MVYTLAKTRAMRSTYISDRYFINSLEGRILIVGSDIILRWLTYFDDLVICEHSRAEVELQQNIWRERRLSILEQVEGNISCPEKDQTIYIQEKEVSGLIV